MIITALSMMPNPTNGMALFAKTSPEEEEGDVKC
jgi:hypothetical protein